MQKQLYFIQHKQLGYDREHVLVLPMAYQMHKNIGLIKTEFRRDPNVLSLARCQSTPVSIAGGYNMRSATMPAGEQLSVTANPIDEDYIRTTGLQLIAGEDLSEQDLKDAYPEVPPGAAASSVPRTFHFILNESAARALGWSLQEAIGKKMFSHLLVKLSGSRLPETIAGIGARWKTLVPYLPFEYRFLDEDYNRLYEAEQRLGTVMNLFSLVAIVLACLGLFGLSAYAARQRVKEIGIRKVLGASLPGLVVLLSGSFVRLALVAIVIAMPLAGWVMHRWLRDFTYRVDIDAWVFAGAALLVVGLRGSAAELFFNAGHLRVRCTVSGKGSTLLFLHAGYQDLYMWDQQESFFKQYYQVVRMDLPGHGQTMGIDTSLEVADVIRIVMDSLHIGRASVVGLSMGASCATDFTLAYPDRVRKLIVVSPGLSGWPAAIKMDTMTKAIFNRMDSVYATGDHQLMAKYFTAVWCDGVYRSASDVDKRVRDYIYTTTAKNKMDSNAFPVFNRGGAATRLKEIKCPVLIIQGDKDLPFILQVTAWYKHELPEARLVNFTGVAHMLNMEKPEEFNRVVYAWLK